MAKSASTGNQHDRQGRIVVAWAVGVVSVAALLWIIFGNRESPPAPAPPTIRGTLAIIGSPAATGVPGLYIATPGGSPRKIIGRVSLEPSWSANGKHVLVNRPSESAPALLIIDAATGRARTLTATGLPAESAWSPAGSQIVFSTQYGDLWLIRPNGAGLRRLTDPQGSCVDGAPSWSPEGTQIAFARQCGKQGPHGLYIIDANAAHLHRIASNPRILRTSWSPDGKTIAFSQLDGPQVDSVHLIGVHGNGARLLVANADSPSWSPDGRSLAVVRSATVEFFGIDGQSVGTLETGDLSVDSVTWAS
jgi:Tol biopolymer transport system component